MQKVYILKQFLTKNNFILDVKLLICLLQIKGEKFQNVLTKEISPI